MSACCGPTCGRHAQRTSPMVGTSVPGELLLPLLSAHWLLGDSVDGLDLLGVPEHAEVLADRDERRMLVVQPHSHTAINVLRDLGNGTRGGLVDFFGREQRHSGHERFDALAAVSAYEQVVRFVKKEAASRGSPLIT